LRIHSDKSRNHIEGSLALFGYGRQNGCFREANSWPYPIRANLRFRRLRSPSSSPFSNFRFGVPETGLICDSDSCSRSRLPSLAAGNPAAVNPEKWAARGAELVMEGSSAGFPFPLSPFPARIRILLDRATGKW
jgi:hypothetical protein